MSEFKVLTKEEVQNMTPEEKIAYADAKMAHVDNMLEEGAKALRHTVDREKEKQGKFDHIKYSIQHVITYLDDVLPDSREKSLTRTKLEEAELWASKAIWKK